MKDLEQTGKTILLSDFEMYFELHGKGKPLLLLHGFTGSGADLIPLFQPLTQHFQLIIPDLRGHGRSTNPSKQFSFHQVALDLFALLEHLQVDTCSAIGFSGGGCTLLHMANLKPNIITAMILVSAAPYFPQKTKEIMRQFTIETRSEAEWRAMRKIHAHGDEQIKMLWEQARAFSESEEMNFTANKLKAIQAKTLIVQGDRDPIYPLDLAIKMYEHIPNSYLWIVPNAGHVPSTPDFLESFITFVELFLS
jgi:pimeloyl-ACP methyl ester carboxylesterase